MRFFESESVGAHWGLIPLIGIASPKHEEEVANARARLTPYNKKKFEPLFRIYDETH